MNESTPFFDSHLHAGIAVVRAAAAGAASPEVRGFFDAVSNTVSYVAWDPATMRAAIVDSVLDFDLAAGRTSTRSADAIIAFVEAERLKVDWLLETHAHADHLSAATYLRDAVGGRIAIGRGILRVQHLFGEIFNSGADFSRDGSEFDRLFDDGDRFEIGTIAAIALHVPGHTPADAAYVIGDTVFTGDTLFMPDYGTARADFPGGDARQLYRSIRRLLELPQGTRMFLCHDYKAEGRDAFEWETTVGAQRTGNVHIHEGIEEDAFVAMRMSRDAALSTPQLILPSVQVNMRAGNLPEPEANGARYLKIPLDVL